MNYIGPLSACQFGVGEDGGAVRAQGAVQPGQVGVIDDGESCWV